MNWTALHWTSHEPRWRTTDRLCLAYSYLLLEQRDFVNKSPRAKMNLLEPELNGFITFVFYAVYQNPISFNFVFVTCPRIRAVI